TGRDRRPHARRTSFAACAIRGRSARPAPAGRSSGGRVARCHAIVRSRASIAPADPPLLLHLASMVAAAFQTGIVTRRLVTRAPHILAYGVAPYARAVRNGDRAVVRNDSASIATPMRSVHQRPTPAPRKPPTNEPIGMTPKTTKRR